MLFTAGSIMFRWVITAAARVIYCGATFRWHEQSFSEWLAERFSPLSRIFDSGFALPVVNCSATYPAPLRQDALVVLSSWTSSVGNSKGVIAATVETKHVWVELGANGDFSSAPFPNLLRSELAFAKESST
ncbi:hotdog domain-containing protein [Arthrobacter sp. ISL-5]|uniref:acyl-CoA thioesterase n=1 Tax=Arthrobacter sp. ISL-5 TaxID=2819111 RepID=UPI001BEC0F7C|nr:hotdog domain-containing protein [Arthrobacter sp. ISL-5]MBT2554187.1 hypothetical protein [Arthrobacter sp. ISL-5]